MILEVWNIFSWWWNILLFIAVQLVKIIILPISNTSLFYEAISVIIFFIRFGLQRIKCNTDAMLTQFQLKIHLKGNTAKERRMKSKAWPGGSM